MTGTPKPQPDATTLLNADVDWDRWPVSDYLAENYLRLHPADAAVIDHHSQFYRQLAPGSIARSLELGAGPNLYPLMLAAGCSAKIEAWETSRANVAYLQQQLRDGPDPHWQEFYRRCRRGNPALPLQLRDALARVRVRHADARSIPPAGYDLASMHYVAEGATESPAEFQEFCRLFVSAVRPGGQLVAAFMENLGRYQIATGPQWPGYRVDASIVRNAFETLTTDLRIERIDPDPSLPAYGYSGMLMLTARRSVQA